MERWSVVVAMADSCNCKRVPVLRLDECDSTVTLIPKRQVFWIKLRRVLILYRVSNAYRLYICTVHNLECYIK